VREVSDGGADEPGGAGGYRAAEAGAVRELVEPRSRAEYAADLEQRATGGWTEVSFRSARVAADGADRAEAVRRFEPRQAGLPEAGDAAAYLETKQAERPWLGAARGCPPEVQRVFVALDHGGGHAHIRHEGWVTEEMNRRRVAYLEDPAQLDPDKRAAGIDGLKSSGSHRCRASSSRITDADAFAEAFARGIEHPQVRAALDTEFTPKQVPRPVSLEITSLLGNDGHRYCTGWRLQPAEGSMDTARAQRAQWLAARAQDRDPGVPEPEVRPVEAFAGGKIVFVFGPTAARDGYEVVTMYPRPARDDEQGDAQ